MYPDDFYYTEEHEWINKEGYIGITDYGQKELGDIVFVELPEENEEYEAGEEFATVESVKAVSPVYCPVSGSITEINSDLNEAPELINQQPHEDGWLVKIEIQDETELDELMDVEEYKDFIGE